MPRAVKQTKKLETLKSLTESDHASPVRDYRFSNILGRNYKSFSFVLERKIISNTH
jgi:hypothetical protein